MEKHTHVGRIACAGRLLPAPRHPAPALPQGAWPYAYMGWVWLVGTQQWGEGREGGWAVISSAPSLCRHLGLASFLS